MTTMEPQDRRADRVRADEQAVLDDAEAAVEPFEQAIDLTPLDVPHRMLLVHAHPDDETIGTGATMAKYAAAGDRVTLVTCTLGEEGEILVPELQHLAADRDDELGPYREGELAAAMAVLGVADHRFLGGPGRWRDSGMMGLASNDNPACFWRADIDEAVGALVAVMREVRPQVVISYNDVGGYGHPDHIQAHRITVAAFDASGDPGRYPAAGEPWIPVKLYETAIPISVLRAGYDALKELGEAAPFGITDPDQLSFGIPDNEVTTVIDAREQLNAKVAAMRAHRTQISVDGPFFALSNNIGQSAFGVEYFRLTRGVAPSGGQESDLFENL
jgi:N-acetyl-1-D-myo-inositol-2-amino-2-deoxy-alpha-D-glucopyranoside deacetylase